MADKTISIKITAAVVIGGEIRVANTVLPVEEVLARNLLRRGRAVLAPGSGGTDLSKLTVVALKSQAVALDIEGSANMGKPALIAAIVEAEAAPAD